MRSVPSLLTTLLALAPFAVEPVVGRRDRQDQHVLLPPAPIIGSPDVPELVVAAQVHEFTLRHIFHKGSHQYPHVHKKVDIHPDTRIIETAQDGTRMDYPKKMRVHSRHATIQRMVDRRRTTIDRLLEAGRLRGEAVSLPPSAWTVDDISAPNVTDKETVISFARMASNAYVEEPNTGEWQNVGGGFNYTEDFGWQHDGLRGHIFADTENKTVVIGLKGTSPAVFDGSDTTGNDKMNDNLFGSCCCGQGGQYLWKQVCDCQTSTYTCNSTCLVKNLREKGHYYTAAQELYHNVTALYPNASIWLTGHSLGGVVTSLLGLTFGLPTLTYETFPDALAAGRLALPTPPGYHIGRHQSRPDTATYHFGHTADPIYMGTCNAASSFCTIAGYAFQGQCHTGSSCTYDTVGDLGWRVAIGTHKIGNVIRDVLEKYDHVPKCTQDTDCIDCFNWKFYESNGTDTTTSALPTSTSSTRTRVETCKTPGWWGCLDESTTISTATMTSTITTTTCMTPGWFGCKDERTTTQTTTITSPSPAPAPTLTTDSSKPTSTIATSSSAIPSSTVSSASSTSTAGATSTCRTPGWFGCKDFSSTSSARRSSSSVGSSGTACTSADWFGLVCVDPSPDAAYTNMAIESARAEQMMSDL